MSAIKLYRHPLSGHSHRVEAQLSLLGLEAEIIDVDLMSGAQKQPEFLSKNSFGQVPAIDDGEVTISDSNAILVYLASKYDNDRTWYPSDLAEQAEVQRFLSVAAGKIAFGPAAARLVNVFGAGLDHKTAIDTSHGILTLLEAHLEGRNWLATNNPTIADTANYAYIAHAPEGDVSLETYPNIRAWIKRFESLKGFVAFTATPVGLSA